MTDIFNDANQGLIIDLKKLAFNNACYVAWVGSGAGMGAFVGSGAAGLGAGPGALIGGLGGLIWAVKTCKPASDAASSVMTTTYLTEQELRSFQSRLNQYTPVSREQAIALAKVALDNFPQPHSAPLPVDFATQLKLAMG